MDNQALLQQQYIAALQKYNRVPDNYDDWLLLEALRRIIDEDGFIDHSGEVRNTATIAIIPKDQDDADRMRALQGQLID